MYNYYNKKRHRAQPKVEMTMQSVVVNGEEVLVLEPTPVPNLPSAEHFKTENLVKAGLNPDEVIKVQTSVGTGFEMQHIANIFEQESLDILDAIRSETTAVTSTPTPAPAVEPTSE